MKITSRSRKRLAEIILGGSIDSPYRTGRDLVEFFHDYGENDEYGPGFPARAHYVDQKLRKYNGTETMSKIVLDAFNFFDDHRFDPKNQAENFNRILFHDGFQLVFRHQTNPTDTNWNGKNFPHFEIISTGASTTTPESLITIHHGTLNEQIEKAKDKIASGDYAGAIASCYTLTEKLLKIILREEEVGFNENEGDIRKLYRDVREPLNLNPAREEITRPLKPILEGLQKLVSGINEISNKASDRHDRQYNPAAHHAKLVVNTTFAFCEFLIESRDYQNSKKVSQPI